MDNNGLTDVFNSVNINYLKQIYTESSSSLRKPSDLNCAIFVIVRGPRLGISFSINQEECLTIGSSSDADIQLTDRGVSRKHLCGYWVKNKVYVEDLHSSNGTRVNTAKISSQKEIKQGDCIHIGANTVIRFIRSNVYYTK